MTVYFTADLHIGHEKVAETRVPKLTKTLGRVSSTSIHDALIRSNLRNTLTKRDQLWILGDISAGGSAAQRNALAFLKDIRNETGVELHLVPGNHDGCHPQFRTAKKWWPEYLEVFDTIMPFASRKIAGQKVCLSHYPFDGDHTDKDRHTQWRLRDEGRWLLHGHTHQDAPLDLVEYGVRDGVPWGRDRYITVEEARDRDLRTWWTEMEPDKDDPLGIVRPTINVGLDAWDMKPVSLETIANIIESLENPEGGL
ncbi:metallophosphoesterase [Gordonia phage BrutonGaster]|uniref:Metallophosphoesterase n=1 Tax=Gordonia phage BrutonGaster TaxID=2530116 RepID=A0A482JH63_9CAUD|nr:metallophosphoesterase [Gordonia phage BrutonGaster]QBP33275.1 metallophosphoesterase [Gordonia phage BrutonGaster]